MQGGVRKQIKVISWPCDILVISDILPMRISKVRISISEFIISVICGYYLMKGVWACGRLRVAPNSIKKTSATNMLHAVKRL